MRFLVYDTGLSVEHALRLKRDGNEVLYFTPWSTAFPSFKDFAPGLGVLEKTKYFFDHVDWADCIVFFDIGFGDLAHFLREKGYTVYGAGLGERLELNRFEFRKIQKEIGLPTQKTVEIKGITKLREYLKEIVIPVHVKLDVFRGDRDTFKVKSYEDVELILDEIDMAFGPFKDDYRFIVEEDVPAIVELGIDGFFNGKDWVRPSLFGLEHHKSCYLGKYVERLPEPMENTMRALTPVLRELGYRGAISTEERIFNRHQSYLIDISARLPYPLSALYTESINNFSELIYKIAGAESVTLKPASKYVAALPLETPHAETHWVKLLLRESDRKRVKMRVFCKSGRSYYAVKGMTSVFVLIALGDNIEELIEELEKSVESIDAYGLDTDAAGGLHQAYEAVEKMRKAGIEF